MPKNNANLVSLSAEERPTKHLRTSPSDPTATVEDVDELSSSPSLQPEIWAIIMDHLPYQSVLSSAAVSRSMLYETMPLITMLHIDNSFELHAGVASRYLKIRDIYIYSLLLQVNDPRRCSVDQETADRAVPFLTKFPNLERVFLGKQTNDRFREVQGFFPFQTSSIHDKHHMYKLIHAFSAAFRAGALSRKLWVLGLRCPRSCHHKTSPRCMVCINACRSFPLESVGNFECNGSSSRYMVFNDGIFDYSDLYLSRAAADDSALKHSGAYTEQLYSLDVCLGRDHIEDIVKSRPGGHDILYSQTRFLSLLGRGTRHIVVPDEGKVLYVVKYDAGELGELKNFIKHSKVDVTMFPPDVVTDAIKKSFAEDERDPLPPRDQCYLAKNSFDELKGMGLSIDETDFLNGDEWDGTKYCTIHPRSIYSYYNWRFY